MLRNSRTTVRQILSAVLILIFLTALLPARAAGQSDREYIVKYKDSAALLAEDDSPSPFDVVSEAEMLRLEQAGVLEWYEEDGDAILLDRSPEGALMEMISPFYDDTQWNLELIGADAAYRQGFLGQGVRVGVVDSGINPHSDFGMRLLKGHNYIQDAEDPDETFDRYGHGTRVAGVIAGSGESGHIGAAPGAQLIPLKVTNEKLVKISAICNAIYGGVRDYHCDVLNLSLGVSEQYEALEKAIAYCEEMGVVVISAVGNNGDNTCYFPAGYDTVIGAGAVDSSGTLYSNSNHNKSVFITAPGVAICSTASWGGYASATGTSYAVPHAAGAAAAMLSADPTLTPAAIRGLMRETAVDAGPEGYDEFYGYGILNLAGCIEALTGSAEVPADGPCTLLPASGPAGALRNNTEEAIAWMRGA